PEADPINTFFKLTRLQFIPLIILPTVVGASLAFRYHHVLNTLYLVFTLAGVILLHLGANAIDDCYDYQNGVDQIADSTFPKDFGGWKPIPRGLISLRAAKTLSYSLLVGSLSFAAYFTVAVGPWSFILGASGVILAIIYTAPPLKLDYRGYGLGELAIFFAFGPIPVVGSFYIQTGLLSMSAFLVSVPIGILTVTILIDHDLIFYEVYSAAKKLSLGTVLGRGGSLKASLSMTIFSYMLVFVLVGSHVLPVLSLLAPAVSALVLLRTIGIFKKLNVPPPMYIPFTVNGLFANWCFSLVLAITTLI
ncbi:MAG: prenyltransferase, partial [Nitrososphaerales archaeon]